ncbi:MAG: VOC family protein [Actinobacteria bacterium]|nr:VOC family protein [Actinomycetota bacterium]
MREPSLHHAQVFYPPGGESSARAFYSGRLGLPEIPRLAKGRGAGLWFAAGTGQVHLAAEPDLHLHPRRHFALRVDDLDVVVARLEAAGDRLGEAHPIPGWRRIYAFDPFGNKVELDEIPEP